MTTHPREPELGWEQSTQETSNAYAVAAERALAEAEHVRDRWVSGGDSSGVEVADRLLGFLQQHRDNARKGILPSREFGYALTRFMDDYEWRPEGSRLQDLVCAMRDIWAERA